MADALSPPRRVTANRTPATSASVTAAAIATTRARGPTDGMRRGVGRVPWRPSGAARSSACTTPRVARTSRMNSPAEANRSVADLASALEMRSSTVGGMSGRRSSTLDGDAFRWA
jgi:hypothetical protein